MSEKQSRRFFIPPWLDDLKLRPIPFRVFCNLLRRAGDNGKCYPSAQSIASDCRINRDTVWPTIKVLIEAGLITKEAKGFQQSNCYVINFPTGGNEGPIDTASTGGNEGVIESLQSAETRGLQSAETDGCQSAETRGLKEIHSKKSILKKSNRENSLEGNQFAIWFKSSLPESVNLKANWQDKFAKAHDDMVRLDNRTPEQIREVCRWARTDSFWKPNFMSPLKLRERNPGGIQYFDVFAEKMKQPSAATSKPAAAANNGNRRGLEETLKS